MNAAKPLNSGMILSLSLANPMQVEIIWLVVSSQPDEQSMHMGEPPDWSACKLMLMVVRWLTPIN